MTFFKWLFYYENLKNTFPANKGIICIL